MDQSKELKQFGTEFLLTFTAELIRQRGGAYFYKLKHILEEELSPESKIEKHKKKKKSKGKEKAEEDWEEYEKSKEPETKKEKEKEEIKKLLKEKKEKSSPKEIKKRLEKPRRIPQTRERAVLRVPETRLPKQFQYLKPQPNERDIELGKLEDLANDPNVREIECNGPEKNVYVRGRMGYQPTQINLSENEISDLLERFSNKSQIPIMAGNYHVAVGDLTLTAQIKEDRGKSTFIIKKMHPGQRAPQPQRQKMPQQAPGSAPRPPSPNQQPSPPKQQSQKEGKSAGQNQIHDEDGDDFSGYQKSAETK